MSLKSSKLIFVILVAIAVPLLILLVHFTKVQAEDATYKLAGWIWTGNYGWISMNSENTEIADKSTYPSEAYQVSITGAEISGWGWSSSVGWVCFGSTCNPNSLDPDSICERWGSATSSPCNFGTYLPSGSNWEAKINTNHTITGWAKVIALNDTGLIKLGMGTPNYEVQKGAQCYDCKASCATWATSTDVVSGDLITTCIATSTTAFDSCNTCFTRTKYSTDPNVNGWRPDSNTESAPGGSGDICFECGSITNKCFKSDANDLLSPIVCPECARCYFYGGAKDDSNGTLLGWAWNGNDDGSGGLAKYGAGWIQLNPTFGGSGIVYPWLQTQYGSVFGQKTFSQKSSISGNNATYCIFANSLTNFKSEKCPTTYSDVALSFPISASSDNVYQNALGKIDILGLSTVANTYTDGVASQSYNKYGNIIVTNSSSGQNSFTWTGEKNFNNQVNIVKGDLYIGRGFKIKNGSGSKRGNGIVIVAGDLIVENDFFYDDAVPTDLRQLASIAWVVKGDIIIKPEVKNIVGAFIALGNGNASCNLSGSKYDLNHCGVFDSGTNNYNGSPEDAPLTISGLLMAKAFNFLRTYSSISRGSEQIIYDGRLSANPPPGLKSIIESLPLVRDFQY